MQSEDQAHGSQPEEWPEDENEQAAYNNPEHYEKYKFLFMPSRATLKKEKAKKPFAREPETLGDPSILTVMMRNLPNKYTQKMLMDEVEKAGFSDTFDFFYLPIDPETRANRGYAFVNFKENEVADRFKLHFDGTSLSGFNSSKIINVTPAALQGFEANYKHYALSRVSRGDPTWRPMFFRENLPTSEELEQIPGEPRDGQSSLEGGASGGLPANSRKQPVRDRRMQPRHAPEPRRSHQQLPPQPYPHWLPPPDVHLDGVHGLSPPGAMPWLYMPAPGHDPMSIEEPAPSTLRPPDHAGHLYTPGPAPYAGPPPGGQASNFWAFCPFCGQQLENRKHQFCQFCGERIDGAFGPAGDGRADDQGL